MKKFRFLVLGVVLVASVATSVAATLKGKVIDESTQQPLIGATILVKGTTQGVTTNFDGEFELKVDRKPQTLAISYISYVTQELQVEGKSNKLDLLVKLATDTKVMDAVKVSTRVSKESEFALQNERIASNVAIENLGAKEMSIKGISNVEDGVKKITGISIEDAGQVFVRGLGDRYSLTTMNGLLVASPNPDNKLIPLDLFPSSVVKNITVSKVYKVSAFADYSGALIDIATKDVVTKDFLTISANVGATYGTIGEDFYKGDRGSLWSTPKLSSEVKAVSNSESQTAALLQSKDVFGTDFSAEKSTGMPDFGVQMSAGKMWKLKNDDKLSALLSLGMSQESDIMLDSFRKVLDANGQNTSYRSDEDTYSTDLQATGLFSMNYSFSNRSRIGYNLFYVRSAEDSYSKYICDDDNTSYQGIYGSGSTLNIYTLLNNQLTGVHELNDKLKLNWQASYGATSSSEPDRRQILFKENTGADKATHPYIIYGTDPSNNMRYFGELEENEMVGNVNFDYALGDGEGDVLRFGLNARSKDRDFHAYKFFYKYNYDSKDENGNTINNSYNPTFENIFDTSDQVNQDKVSSGLIMPDNGTLVNDKYFANSDIYAAFADVDYNFGKLLVNLGVRVESASQSVEYWDDSPISETATIEGVDLFPAANLKYKLNDQSSLRFAASRTVTRPSFIEMAPFLYQASSTSVVSRGNQDIQNGYNYNVDLRYELFKDKSTDMISVTAYYKFLDSPIERVQNDAGGDVVYTYQNSDSGMAAGLEFELRKQIIEGLKFNFNASYIFTDVTLEEGKGIYTDTNRQLQGASPYLLNADLSYGLKVADESQITFSLLYNLQGPRIDAVGVNGLNDVMQEDINSLDFVCVYNINPKLSMKLKFDNLLAQDVEYTQDIKSTGETIIVGRDKTYQGAQIGLTYNF